MTSASTSATTSKSCDVMQQEEALNGESKDTSSETLSDFDAPADDKVVHRRTSGRKRRAPVLYSPSEKQEVDARKEDSCDSEEEEIRTKDGDIPLLLTPPEPVEPAQEDAVVLRNLRRHIRAFRSHLRILSQTTVLDPTSQALIMSMKCWQQ